ncbi:MAG: N(1)-aminopropylagmatine ureohydrolase [Phycisphaerae bacterium]|nr:N(1)-aminopropylagmatine ureohydrolase [Phycisphaerae bacterium]
MTSQPDNFLGLPQQYADYRKARFAVLPIPYDATTSFMTGTRHGPRAIITASQQTELYDMDLGREFYQAGVATLEPLFPNVAGPQAMAEDIYHAAKPVVRDGKFLISLGGEHSISSGLVRAVREKYKKLSVLQIDAHADLRAEYEGSPHSHACVMRRIHESGTPICGVGIRNYSVEEARYIKQKKITLISALDCLSSEDWLDRVLAALTDDVYVTIDIDGFDPAFAPGTGTPEPGGLDWYTVNALLQAVALEKRIVAADIVEVTPIPGQVVTEFLAAKLAYRLISYVQHFSA